MTTPEYESHYQHHQYKDMNEYIETMWKLRQRKGLGLYETGPGARAVPVVQEEAVLDEEIQEEVDKALHSHESHILPHKVPAERIHSVLLSWRDRQS